jgi:hypothetical protein
MASSPAPRRTIGLAIALTVTLGVGTVAAGPSTGFRDIQDFAAASFQTRLTGSFECLFVDVTVNYFAGDNLQSPIGSGKPTYWSDAPTQLSVFDSCDGDAEVLRVEGLGFPDDGPDFERLERASLDVTSVLLSDGLGTSIEAEIHLDWTGNDDTTVAIGHDVASRTFRQERSESATVTGTVQFGASSYWSELTATGDDSHDVRIGTANEVGAP